MDPNPYESTLKTGTSRRTRSTKWLVWAGVVCLVIAALCTAATVMFMIYSFKVVADSPTPRAEDLASGIGMVKLSSIASAIVAIPLALLGIALLVAGLLIRRRGQ